MKLIRELANNVKHFYSQGTEIEGTTGGLKWNELTCDGDYEGIIIITKNNK